MSRLTTLPSRHLPGLDWDDIEELEDVERERLERILEAVTLTGNAAEIRAEIDELRELAAQARPVEESGDEAKLSRLRETLDGSRLLR